MVFSGNIAGFDRLSQSKNTAGRINQAPMSLPHRTTALTSQSNEPLSVSANSQHTLRLGYCFSDRLYQKNAPRDESHDAFYGDNWN